MYISIYQEALYEEIMCSSYWVLCLYFLCETRKEVRMEICKVDSFYQLQVKFVTLQELHANNTRLLIRDLNSICKHLWVIVNEYQIWVELYRIVIMHVMWFNQHTFSIMHNTIFMHIRGIARLYLTLECTLYNTPYVATGMLVHTCINLWLLFKNWKARLTINKVM